MGENLKGPDNWGKDLGHTKDKGTNAKESKSYKPGWGERGR